jgi:amino acid transporter/nucleotide-binding universal stress UspA family protein
MSEADQELARDLGFLEAYTIGLGTMIGAGIFVLPSIAAEQAGPASMISFFAGGFVSLLAALSLSELATGMPRAGGSYYYVNRALGPFFGSIVGWGMWAGLTFASAFYMIGFGQYLLPGLGQYIGFLADWGQIGITVAALVMAALLTAVNYYGVKETGSLQNVIVLTLVGLITAFLTLGIISGPTTGEFNPNGWPAVAATIGTVYVTFIGFEVIATSAEEIKNPSRNLPLAMIASVVTPTLMYVGVMFVSTGALSVEALTVSQIPVADVATEFMGPIGALAMIIGAVLATVSSANASILSAARVNFAMGRDRILVNWLNEVHERFRTPYRAITATGVVTLVLIAIGVGIGTLAEVASFMYLVTYALVHVTVIVLRRANPDAYDPAFQIPSILYPIVPVIGTLACLAVLVQMSIEFVPATVGVGPVGLVLPVTPTAVGAIGTVLIVFGIGWYYFYARNRALSESLVGEAIAPEPAAMADGEGRYRVVVPVANPETEQDLLQMAAASAHAHEDEHAEVIAVNIIEVPRQTSLSQDLTFEEDRVEQQQKLLDSARDIVANLDIGLQTRAIVGRNAGSVILDVIEEENADHVFLGWRGTRSRREYVLGSTIDPVIGRAPCDATLVKLGPEDSYGEGDVMVLAGKGPHAPVAARRAAEFVSAADDDASLTLLNVQTLETDTDADLSPTERGETVAEELAERAGIEYMSYNAEVKVAEDTEQAIIEAAKEYDTVCVGATRSGPISQAVFGSLPEKVGAGVDQTVVMARGPEESPMSVRQALLQRLVGQA